MIFAKMCHTFCLWLDEIWKQWEVLSSFSANKFHFDSFCFENLVTFEQDKSWGPGPKASEFDVRPAEKKLLPNGAMTMGSLAFVAGAVDAVCCTKYRCFLEHLGFDLLWPHSSLILWHNWGYTNMMTGNSASWLWWMYFVCLFVCIQECFFICVVNFAPLHTTLAGLKYMKGSSVTLIICNSSFSWVRNMLCFLGLQISTPPSLRGSILPTLRSLPDKLWQLHAGPSSPSLQACWWTMIHGCR